MPVLAIVAVDWSSVYVLQHGKPAEEPTLEVSDAFVHHYHLVMEAFEVLQGELETLYAQQHPPREEL